MPRVIAGRKSSKAAGGAIYRSVRILEVAVTPIRLRDCFDPVLRLDDVQLEMHSSPMSIFVASRCWESRVDRKFGKRIKTLIGKGLSMVAPASTTRSGWSDMYLRMRPTSSVPRHSAGEEFAKHRAETEVETLVGLGLVVQIPTGHYIDDRLLNLGTNRYTFRSPVGHCAQSRQLVLGVDVGSVVVHRQ